MAKEERYIQLDQICAGHKIEMSFFTNLNEIGLIEIITIKHSHYVHQDKINEIEKMIRLYQELDVNLEGIDVIFNLLHKVDVLQKELIVVKNRLSMYEGDTATGPPGRFRSSDG